MIIVIFWYQLIFFFNKNNVAPSFSLKVFLLTVINKNK